jgi:hypothetical protein
MYRILLSFITVFILSITSPILQASDLQASDLQAAEPELQGYGAFNRLNKDWMLLALYSKEAESTLRESAPHRLEIKVVTEKISQRRFRQLWLDALAVEYGPGKMALMKAELDQFFNILQGPLKQGDTLVIENGDIDGLVVTNVTLNYHNLAQLSEGFLNTLVQSLVGKHPPTQVLKSGLMGNESIRHQMALAIRFDRLEPTLPRIAEISRWGKRIIVRNNIIASKTDGA